jgi:CheY-like chemotaxis protein
VVFRFSGCEPILSGGPAGAVGAGFELARCTVTGQGWRMGCLNEGLDPTAKNDRGTSSARLNQSMSRSPSLRTATKEADNPSNRTPHIKPAQATHETLESRPEPIAEAVQGATQSIKDKEEPLRVTAGVGSTVLLVDDDAAVRQMMQTALERGGYTVLSADSESLATWLWRRNKQAIDLLISDMLIPPGSTGLSLAKQFQVEKPDLKVIFVSGFGSEIGDGDTAFLRRAPYLQKPFDAERLLYAVEYCFGRVRPFDAA